MELFVEEITDCLKEVHMELVKQRLSQLKAAGGAMSRHVVGAGVKDWQDDIPVCSERAFEHVMEVAVGVSVWRQCAKQMQVLSDACKACFHAEEVGHWNEVHSSDIAELQQE